MPEVLATITESLKSYHPAPDVELINRAYSFAGKHHTTQTRASGEPYINHVANVALLATKLRLDNASVAAALLHDTVEDTDITLQDIATEFGEDIADLVDGVTKITRINFRSKVDKQAENFRKMLIAMSKDIRVLLIKLCDRTHNMRTLQHLSEARRRRISQETQDIYAPLAHRLGIYWMKSELEDACLRFLQPEAYELIKKGVAQRKDERERYIRVVETEITDILKPSGFEFKVSGRPKHFASIYEKMLRTGFSVDEIHDLIGFRIIVNSTSDCYAVLGLIHAKWRPIPGRFKDYVAMPKANGYQSLHTSIVGPKGERVEIQIRTEQMHSIAERGIAAHWRYKEGGEIANDGSEEFKWLRSLVESEKLLADPVEFMSVVKDDLFSREVFVFSPKGDLVSLAAGATPVDFAYSVHSEVGDHCKGARVNGRQVSLAYTLTNGDTVEILTSETQHPSKDWLEYTVTSKAKHKIRSYLKSQERERNIEIGSELLTKELRKHGKGLGKFKKAGDLKRASSEFGQNSEEQLFVELGTGKLPCAKVVEFLIPSAAETEVKQTVQSKPKKRKSAVLVGGMDDIVFRFASCCQPLPGEEIVGYITRGRGVTVHSRSCPQTLHLDSQRMVTVAWDEKIKTERKVAIRVHCFDRLGILNEMTLALSSTGVSIVSVNANTYSDGNGIVTFEVILTSQNQYEQISRGLEGVKGVIKVEKPKRKIV